MGTSTGRTTQSSIAPSPSRRSPATAPKAPADAASCKEAQTASALNHPDIITIHDVVSQDNTEFMILWPLRVQYSGVMSALDPILMELDQEAATTARVLQRIPEEHLTWKPHNKSMSLGQLAMHIAMTPGMIAAMLAGDSFQLDPAAFDNLPGAASRQQVLDTLTSSVAQAKQFVGGLDAERASATWRLMAGPRELMAAPRAAVIRTIMLNHWYHHRGQLTVYLRLLNVPVPVVYGRSADESAFGPPAA